MAYNSPYQPNIDKQQFQKMGLDAGRSILQNVIIYGFEAIKFIVNFIIEALHSVIGK
jgi:hypothetical protein